jgi:hypothetical protein
MTGSRLLRLSTRAALILLVAALLAAAVAACGGSAPSAGSGPADTGGAAAASSNEFVSSSTDAVTDNGGTTEITQAIYPSGRDNDEISPTGATAVKPCQLVTKAEATAILGKGVTVSEELQGPTCVYSAAGRQITLVVEEVTIKGLREGARKARKVRVAGRQGWCLTYETTSVVVPFDRNRILHVSGPCQAGVRFAAAALR